MFIVKFRKVGDSYVITVPRDAIETLSWRDGEKIVLEATRGMLVAHTMVQYQTKNEKKARKS